VCGIVHVRRSPGTPAAKTVLKRFQKQRHRGTTGFGYVTVENGHVTNVVKAQTENEIRQKLIKEKASEILFHHRQPTGGQPNLIGLAHPFRISADSFEYDYLMVHNGMISNDTHLKKKHEELGFKYQTEFEKVEETKVKVVVGGVEEEAPGTRKVTTKGFNDSESLAWELALYLEGYQDKIEVKGGAAFIIYQLEKGTDKVLKMSYGCNLGRPLKVEMGGKKKKKKNGGDIVAIKSEGNGTDVTHHKLYTIHYGENRLDLEEQSLDLGYSIPDRRTDFRSSPNNVHNRGVGYGKNKDNIPRGGGNDTAPTHGENGADIDALFPHVVDQDEDNQAKKEYDAEQALVEQLEARDAEGLQKKADQLLERMMGLNSDLEEVERQIRADGYGGDNYARWEKDKILEQRERVVWEFHHVNKMLVEYGIEVDTSPKATKLMDLPYEVCLS
jgi:hypothetical protein